MKYNVFGFSQKKMVDLDLDIIDAALLRELVDFYATGQMIEKEIGGKRMFWVKYSSLIEQLPIAKIKNSEVMGRRLKKLVNAGILEYATYRNNGTFSFYCFTNKLREITYSTQTSGAIDSKVGGVSTQTSEQKTLLSKDSSNRTITPRSSAEAYEPEEKDFVSIEEKVEPCVPCSEKKKVPPPDALRISDKLAAHVLSLSPRQMNLQGSKRAVTVGKWAADIEKLHRINGWSWKEIDELLAWVIADSFWCSNILSGSKLRAQADTLRAKMAGAKKATHHHNLGTIDTNNF